MNTNVLLYAVTDRNWLHENETLAWAVEQAILGGATMIQLREKELETDAFIALAKEIKVVCARHRIPLIINDSLETAKAVDADGVHLGQGDMDPVRARELLGKNKIIGVTAKTLEQAKKAQADGADYIGSGAVFGSSTKTDAKPMTMELLKEIKKSISIPVAAIGGITEENVEQLIGTGVDGIAVVSGIFAQKDIKNTARKLKKAAYRISGKMPASLTIAGSDSSGGAGIQADLKSFMANGVFGMSAITAITAQNTQGVSAVLDLPGEMVQAQIDAVFADIFPDSVKIGMVSSAEIIRTIADALRTYRPRYIVIDPVMISTSGHKLLADEAMEALKTDLLPLADLITPNLHEAALLWERPIQNRMDMLSAAKEISETLAKNVLIKGGHLSDCSDDLYYDGEQEIWFYGARIQNPNTHGTGCTLSSAIAANLAKDYTIAESIELAKQYITDAICSGLNLGQGSGPLNHMAPVYRRKDGK